MEHQLHHACYWTIVRHHHAAIISCALSFHLDLELEPNITASSTTLVAATPFFTCIANPPPVSYAYLVTIVPCTNGVNVTCFPMAIGHKAKSLMPWTLFCDSCVTVFFFFFWSCCVTVFIVLFSFFLSFFFWVVVFSFYFAYSAKIILGLVLFFILA